jgi:hypothetical protein
VGIGISSPECIVDACSWTFTSIFNHCWYFIILPLCICSIVCKSKNRFTFC